MLIRNSAVFMVAKLLPALFGLATTAALTRLLDPQEYGLYGLELVIMMLGSTIVFDWLGVSFLRFYQARRDDPEIVATFVSMFVALVLLSAAALTVWWLSGIGSRDQVGIAVVGLILVWTFSWFELISRLAVAKFRAVDYLKMNLARSGLILIGAVSAAWLTQSPLWTAVGMAAGMFAAAFVGNEPVPLPSWHRLDRRLVREVVIFGAPLAVSLALYSLIDSGTRVLIEQLDSTRALGLYTAAAVLVQTTLVGMAAGIHSAGYSLAVQAVETGDPSEARRQLVANGSLLLAVLAPASLGIALTGNCLATTLVGPKFASGVGPIIPWMAASSFFGCFRAFHLDQAFQLGEKPHLQIWVTGLAGLIAIGVGWYEIPRVGPIGAAIASALAMAVSCIHAVIAGRHAFPIPFPTAAAKRVALCCGIMTLVVVTLPDSGWTGLILRSSLGAAAYAVSAVALNLLNSRDRAIGLARRAARRRTGFRDDGGLEELAREELVTGSAPTAAMPPFTCAVRLKEGVDELPILFIVPGLGGTVDALAELCAQIMLPLRIYSFRSRGIDGSVPPDTRVEEMADRYLEELRQLQPYGPYMLCGHSFGGLVAFEMARRLRAQRAEVAALILLDTPIHRSFWPRSYILFMMVQRLRHHFAVALALRRKEIPLYFARIARSFVSHILTYLLQRADPTQSADDERSAASKAVWGSQLAAMANYRPDFYPGRMLYFGATIPGPVTLDPTVIWRGRVEELEIRTVEGGHSSMLDEPYVSGLASALAECLRQLRIDSHMAVLDLT